MVYSMRDVYGGASATLKTSEQTIPEGAEEESYIDQDTVPSKEGMAKKSVGSNMIFGSMLLIAGTLLALHFME